MVTDRTDLLPIEIFRGCVQEAKLSPWPPEAHIEPQNHLLGLPPRKDSEHPLRGHFSGAPQLQEPRFGTCRRAGLRRAVCAAGTETDAGPRTMKAMRDLQSARKLLANVLRCDGWLLCSSTHVSRTWLRTRRRRSGPGGRSLRHIRKRRASTKWCAP